MIIKTQPEQKIDSKKVTFVTLKTKKFMIGINQTHKPSQGIHVFPKGSLMRIRVAIDWNPKNDIVIDAKSVVIESTISYLDEHRRKDRK